MIKIECITSIVKGKQEGCGKVTYIDSNITDDYYFCPSCSSGVVSVTKVEANVLQVFTSVEELIKTFTSDYTFFKAFINANEQSPLVTLVKVIEEYSAFQECIMTSKLVYSVWGVLLVDDGVDCEVIGLDDYLKLEGVK